MRASERKLGVELIYHLLLCSMFAMGVLSFYFITNPVPMKSSLEKTDAEENYAPREKGEDYIPSALFPLCALIVSLGNIFFLTIWKFVLKQELDVPGGLVAAYFGVICCVGGLLSVLILFFIIKLFILILLLLLIIAIVFTFLIKGIKKTFIYEILLFFSVLGSLGIAVLGPTFNLAMGYWILWLLGGMFMLGVLLLMRNLVQIEGKALLSAALFLLGAGFVIGFFINTASLFGGLAAYLLFVFAGLLGVLSIGSIPGIERKRCIRVFTVFFVLVVIGSSLVGSSVGKTDIKIYDAKADREYPMSPADFPHSDDSPQPFTLSIAVIVINYGGLPAHGSIKVLAEYNNSYIKIAETEHLDSYGKWEFSAELNFAPRKLILEYNGEKVYWKSVRYPVPQPECAILYQVIFLLLLCILIQKQKGKSDFQSAGRRHSKERLRGMPTTRIK